MRDLDLTSLRLFVAVCDSRSIVRVAERENIVPSAISKRLSKLESDLGTPLMTQVRRGVVPTAAGQTLAEHARGLLRDARQITEEMNQYSAGAAGVVQLMANDSSLAGPLLTDISQFLQNPAHRTVRVKTQAQTSRLVMQAVREGSVSFGVLWDTVDLSGLQTCPYRSDQLAVIMHRTHPMAQFDNPSFVDCMEYEHIGMRSTRLVESMLDRTGVIAGRTARYRMEVSSFEAALRLVGENLGILIAPEGVAAPLADLYSLVIKPLTDSWAKRRYVIVFQDEKTLAPTAAMLVKHLVQACAQATADPA